MSRELTDVDVEKLYAFTRKNAVDTYDVQSELVDHLASDIEMQWAENPDLSLEEALHQVYNKFGINGFAEVFKQRVAAIKREQRMQILRTFLTYFKLPYLVFSLLLFVCFQVALNELHPEWVKLAAYFLLLIAQFNFIQKDYAFRTGRIRRKLSLMQYTYGIMGSAALLSIYINSWLLDKLIPELTWPYALNLTIWYILTIAYMRTILAIRQRAQALYPAAFA